MYKVTTSTVCSSLVPVTIQKVNFWAPHPARRSTNIDKCTLYTTSTIYTPPRGETSNDKQGRGIQTRAFPFRGLGFVSHYQSTGHNASV
jgi:hypothetical protein